MDETCWCNVCKPLNLPEQTNARCVNFYAVNLLHDCHGVGKLGPLVPSNLNPPPTDIVQLSPHFVLNFRMASDNPHCPAHHHRLRLRPDDEELPEDGGQPLLREGLLPCIDLEKVGVLQIASSIASVVLPVFPDPLLADLVEPVPVVPEEFHIGEKEVQIDASNETNLPRSMFVIDSGRIFVRIGIKLKMAARDMNCVT